MDGLECSEILLSKVKETYDFRTEAEFYKKEYVAIQEKLVELNANPLANGLSSVITDGTHYTPCYTETGIPFLSALNIQENCLDVTAGYKYISAEQHKELSKRVLPQHRDVLLRKVGVGMRKACVVPKDAFEFSIFVSVALIRPKINPYLLSTYINSRFGQLQLLRFNKGISQPDLHLEDIGRMLVPAFSDDIVNQIEFLVLSAEKLLSQSRYEYKQAVDVLNDYLEFDNEDKIESSVSIRNFSKSFETTGRLDAEYYQSKYEKCAELLNTNETVGSMCKLHDKTFLPKEDIKYKYIELSNVGTSGEISEVDETNGVALPSRARRKIRKGQVLISSVEGSLQSCALITSEFDGCLCSTGFYVLDSEYINPETLLVLFKSEVMQALLKQRCSGTILAGISKDELLSMPLPKIDDNIQNDIAAKVQKSSLLRQQSKQLLEIAKQAVEMAIEHGEDNALMWLKDSISHLEV